MQQCRNLHEGVYMVQTGFRNQTAVIICPDISRRIEVCDAHSLKILHGAQVYWTQVRHQYPYKRRGNRQVISAIVVAIKHCNYLLEGKNILCTLKVENSPKGPKLVGCPTNTKLPQFDLIGDADIILPFTLADVERKYFWARFLGWAYDEARPKGCLTGFFSQNFKTPKVETDAILYNMDISQNESSLFDEHFLSDQEDYLPVKGHRQFSHAVFTIDPPGSVDIEDGLSIEEISPGVYEVGVHISDVTSYKHLINRQEISQRGTSIYLPHKTIHMMPSKIIELCALKSKKRRLAFTVFIEVNQEGQILSSRFEKTVVKSIGQFTYEDAQNILNGDAHQIDIQSTKHITENEYLAIASKMRVLAKIAQIRRKRRANVEMFDRSEIVFELNEQNIPINIGLKKRTESQKLIEEFMIMANCEVAKKLVNSFGAHSLIIYHPRPSQYSIDHLNDYLSDFGVKFQADNMLLLERQIQQLIEKGRINDELKQLLMIKAVQIQQFAIYTRSLNTYKGHYGLNLQYYTHFTSPVRRFADLLVHEQLQKCLNGEQLTFKQVQVLDVEIELCNRARTRSKKLKQLIIECFMNMFLYHKKEKIVTKGFIVSLGVRSVSIYVPHYNIIKDVCWQYPATYLDRDRVEVAYKNQSGEVTPQQFQKNDCIQLEIYSEMHQQVRIDLILGQALH